jgi:H+-translocating NAD(P) transhydrogenase subunit beta
MSVEDWLVEAERVVVVPGYGLALAQAQHALRALADALDGRCVFAVHPLAGRVPGHLDLLLDQAGISCDQRHQGDVGGGDVVLAVGANDVLNPALGVPVLDVTRVRHVVVVLREAGPGYAGVENPVLQAVTTALLLGDARERLTELSRAVLRRTAGDPARPRP